MEEPEQKKELKKTNKFSHHQKPFLKKIPALKEIHKHIKNRIVTSVFKRRKPTTHLLPSINKMIENCEVEGLISSEVRKMLGNIIEIGKIRVDDIMIPRTDIIAVKEDVNLEQLRELILSKEHSRIPVYRDNLDKIIGFIHSKDLVNFLGEDPKSFKISNIIRKVLFVPNSMRIVDLLLKMRSSRVHMAVVLDEYGGVDGLVTIEDIVEEIVGEIEDEYDLPDNSIYNLVQKVSDNILHIGGRVEIKAIEDLLGQKILDDDQEGDFDTVGGLILAALKKVPKIGETVKYPGGLTFKVLDADMRSVKLVEIIREHTAPVIDEIKG